MTDPTSITSTSSPSLPIPVRKGILKNTATAATTSATSASPFEGESIVTVAQREPLSSFSTASAVTMIESAPSLSAASAVTVVETEPSSPKEKKSVCFFPLTKDEEKTTEFLRDDPTYGSPTKELIQTRTRFVASKIEVPPASQALLDRASDILTWARDRTTIAKRELEEAQTILSVVKASSSSQNKHLIPILETWILAAKDRFRKAEKYAVWAELRFNVLQGNKNVRPFLHKSGKTMSSAWTIKQIEDDFEATQAESWAQPPDASFDEIRRKVTILTTEKRASETASRAIANTISDVASLPRPQPTPQEESKEPANSRASADSSYIHKDSTLGYKGIYEWEDGSYDFSKPYDLQEIERFDDGTIVKVDPYDGQIYSFPPPPPRGNGACTVS